MAVKVSVVSSVYERARTGPSSSGSNSSSNNGRRQCKTTTCFSDPGIFVCTQAYDTAIFRPHVNNGMDLSYFESFDEQPADTFRGDNSLFEGF